MGWCCTAMKTLRIVTLFRVEIAHAAVSLRPPISLNTNVARTQGQHVRRERLGFDPRSRAHFLFAPCQPFSFRFATFSPLRTSRMVWMAMASLAAGMMCMSDTCRRPYASMRCCDVGENWMDEEPHENSGGQRGGSGWLRACEWESSSERACGRELQTV